MAAHPERLLTAAKIQSEGYNRMPGVCQQKTAFIVPTNWNQPAAKLFESECHGYRRHPF